MTGRQRGRSALIEETIATFVGLGAGAAGVGTNSTSVLRWLVAGTATSGPYITVTDDAAEGTLVQLESPGVYIAYVSLAQVASSSLIVGIAVGAAVVPPFTGVPTLGSQGVIATLPVKTTLAMQTEAAFLSCPFVVPDEEANGTRAIVRFAAAVAAGTTPIPSLTVATCSARIVRVCDQAA